MEEGAPPARVEGEHAIPGLSVEVAIGPASLDEREELVLAPRFRCALRDDLLAEDVERGARIRRAVELSISHGGDERDGFDELIDRQWNKTAPRYSIQGVSGTSDALDEGRDRARRTELDHEVDIADVDSELERCRRDERAEASRFEAFFRIEAPLAREA